MLGCDPYVYTYLLQACRSKSRHQCVGVPPRPLPFSSPRSQFDSSLITRVPLLSYNQTTLELLMLKCREWVQGIPHIQKYRGNLLLYTSHYMDRTLHHTFWNWLGYSVRTNPYTTGTVHAQLTLYLTFTCTIYLIHSYLL